MTSIPVCSPSSQPCNTTVTLTIGLESEAIGAQSSIQVTGWTQPEQIGAIASWTVVT